MQTLDAISQLPWLYSSIALILGLLVGSFLNVVIFRLPVMMKSAWQSECKLLLEIETEEQQFEQQTEKFNLSVPRSRCPKCQTAIHAYQNIPVLSYLILGGKCANCKNPISLRYPSIELVTGLLTAFVACQLGFTIDAALIILFTWALIALTMIDFDHQLLPDQITLPLLWLGLIANSFSLFVPLADALWGAVFGYLTLWLVFWGFKLLTGKEGMGYGDFKLLAALGAWLGWQKLPLVILLSSLVGAIIGISLMLLFKHARNKPIPFGPYLAIAGWIAFFWGDKIIASYINTLQL